MTIETAPFGRKLVEQGDKEFGARPVHVGVGHGDRIFLDGDDHDMRVGGSDIVLNQQPAAGSRRHRIETGMVEF